MIIPYSCKRPRIWLAKAARSLTFLSRIRCPAPISYPAAQPFLPRPGVAMASCCFTDCPSVGRSGICSWQYPIRYGIFFSRPASYHLNVVLTLMALWCRSAKCAYLVACLSHQIKSMPYTYTKLLHMMWLCSESFYLRKASFLSFLQNEIKKKLWYMTKSFISNVTK